MPQLSLCLSSQDQIKWNAYKCACGWLFCLCTIRFKLRYLISREKEHSTCPCHNFSPSCSTRECVFVYFCWVLNQLNCNLYSVDRFWHIFIFFYFDRSRLDRVSIAHKEKLPYILIHMRQIVVIIIIMYRVCGLIRLTCSLLSSKSEHRAEFWSCLCSDE